METLTYQQLMQNILQDYADQHPQDDNIETQVICDTQNHHYLLLYLGWKQEKQLYGCPIHVDIKDNKFWIQRDFTEIGIANQLLKAGISKEKIVLGFRSPFNRQFTNFATT